MIFSNDLPSIVQFFMNPRSQYMPPPPVGPYFADYGIVHCALCIDRPWRLLFPQTDLSVGVLADLVVGRWL